MRAAARCYVNEPPRLRTLSARAAKAFTIYGQLPSYRSMLDREGVEGPADIALVGTEKEVTDGIAAFAGIGIAVIAGGRKQLDAGTLVPQRTLDDIERDRALVKEKLS